MMTSTEIRQKFLDFFKEKGHKIVPSAPIVVKDDPTLLFVNAGMNQFKEFFLGSQQPKNKRVADSQKCLRVSGKHNDLEEVGVDTYHQTLFEMLGNWSFGDYFKKEAIAYAWELLTEVYKINKENLYITVFEGDENQGVAFDEEAYTEWQKWIDKSHILKGNAKDNFWEMGNTGPCGPCSEIHIDLRSEKKKKEVSGASLVNKDHPKVIELWNLVFMEFNRLENGKLMVLPTKNVDTGMGFERLCMVLQGKFSSYDTDIFKPLIQALEKISKKTYSATQKSEDIAFRVIADHIRAISFAIADGQLPSNTGAGYVIRRILRRAVRYGFSFLDLKEPFLFQLSGVLAQQMGDFYPEIKKQLKLVENVIEEEEKAFLHTLEQGMTRFNKYLETTKNPNIDGAFAFELYDTFGFPIDLTQLLAKEKNYPVDMEGFERHLKAQKNRSKKDAETTTGDWKVLKDATSKFVGYDHLEADIRILRYRQIERNNKTQFQLVFDRTPFYPQGGGQVGDTGYIEYAEKKYSIINTIKENNLPIHLLEKLPDDVNVEFKAVVDVEKRVLSARNHSATHLLHFALRETLGKHVEQKGSLVNPEYLRFDFSHFQKVTNEEIASIEKRVNGLILSGLELNEKRQVPIEEARKSGAMMLFGEKYGEKVRMIQFGNSIELCGGTHVKNTASIGIFKIVSESSVASGIRRIEAVTSMGALNYFNDKDNELSQIATLLKNPPSIVKAVEAAVKENKTLKKKAEDLQKGQAKALKMELLNSKKQKGEVNYIIKEVNVEDAEIIKTVAMQLRAQEKMLFLTLAAEINGKAILTIAISDDLLKAKKLNAGQIIRELSKEINGGGGGQPFFATAGGSAVNGVSKALQKAEDLI